MSAAWRFCSPIKEDCKPAILSRMNGGTSTRKRVAPSLMWETPSGSFRRRSYSLLCTVSSHPLGLRLITASLAPTSFGPSSIPSLMQRGSVGRASTGISESIEVIDQVRQVKPNSQTTFRQRQLVMYVCNIWKVSPSQWGVIYLLAPHLHIFSVKL